MAKSSIRDLAEAAGVSVATVSRVFNRHRCVRPEVRERVLAIARDMHYAPSITTSRNLFGVIIGSSKGLHFGAYGDQVVGGITRYLGSEGFQTHILFGNQIDYLHENSFRALIVVCTDFTEAIAASGIKAVTVNQRIGGLPMVATDHAGGLRLAVDRLAGAGHRRIAYLRIHGSDWGSSQREAGFREGLAAHGIGWDDALLARFRAKGDVLAMVRQLLSAKPTALIVEGEDYGPAAFHAVYACGLRIPEDLSVITFEDGEISPYLTPEATTISQELGGLGEVAAETAVRISDPRTEAAVPVCCLMPNRLIERNSIRRIVS